MSFIQRLGQLRSPVSSYINLPLTSNVQGDVRMVTDTGDAYVWMIVSTTGSLTDWKKVTSSNYNELVGSPTATGLAIDDAVKVIKGLSINISLLAFNVLIDYYTNIARMFDGIINKFETNEDGINTVASLHELWVDSAYYHPDNLSETLPTVSMVDESTAPHTITANGTAAMSGNNPLFGNSSLYLDGTTNAYIQSADSNDWRLSTSLSDGNTKLLLHVDNDIIDSSSSPHTLTNVGNTVTFSSSIKKFGTHSAFFNGANGTGLSIPDSADWDFVASNTDDWTMDTWVRFNSLSGSQQIFAQFQNGANAINLEYTGGFWFRVDIAGVAFSTPVAGAVADTTTFHHIAVCKVGNKYAVYKDGVQINYVQNNLTGTIAAPFIVGAIFNGTNYVEVFNGYMDELRFTHSNAFGANPNVGLSNTITVPTAPYSVASNTDFTVDLWVDPLEFSDLNAFIIGQNDAWKLTLDGTSNHYPKFTFVGSSSITGTTSLTANQWNHIAIVQDSGTIKLFVNGVLSASATGSAVNDGTNPLTIGATNTGTNLFNGYIENVRISNNARWTANFTVPAVEYTNDANTKLLLPLNKQTVLNMTLQSIGYVANYVPTSARVVVFEEDIDVVEANVDLTMEVSRDGGTTFTTCLLAKDLEFGDDTLNLFTGSVDLSSQPNGTLMVYRLKTLNNKDCRIRGVSLNWR